MWKRRIINAVELRMGLLCKVKLVSKRFYLTGDPGVLFRLLEVYGARIAVNAACNAAYAGNFSF